MKKIFWGIIATMIIFASVTVVVVAANYATQSIEKDEKVSIVQQEVVEENMNKRVRIVPQEWIDEKYDTSKHAVCIPSEISDDFLDRKFQEFEKQEAEIDAMDMKAYTVVNKYSNKTIYAKQSLISDKKEDCEMMKIMIELLESKKVADEDAILLRSYLERRLVWLDESDSELTHDIKNVLK